MTNMALVTAMIMTETAIPITMQRSLSERVFAMQPYCISRKRCPGKISIQDHHYVQVPSFFIGLLNRVHPCPVTFWNANHHGWRTYTPL
jgi:hypothetical protein